VQGVCHSWERAVARQSWVVGIVSQFGVGMVEVTNVLDDRCGASEGH
jgi:hypothetical protein